MRECLDPIVVLQVSRGRLAITLKTVLMLSMRHIDMRCRRPAPDNGALASGVERKQQQGQGHREQPADSAQHSIVPNSCTDYLQHRRKQMCVGFIHERSQPRHRKLMKENNDTLRVRAGLRTARVSVSMAT
jgi:hypothetical protein